MTSLQKTRLKEALIQQFFIAIVCKLKSDAGFRYVGTRHDVSLQSRMNMRLTPSPSILWNWYKRYNSALLKSVLAPAIYSHPRTELDTCGRASSVTP